MATDSPKSTHLISVLYQVKGAEDVLRSLSQVDNAWKKVSYAYEANGKKMRDVFTRAKDGTMQWSNHTEKEVNKVVKVVERFNKVMIVNGQKVTEHWAKYSDGTTKMVSKTITDLAKAKTGMQNFLAIAQRALIVAPTWMFLRSVLLSFIGTIKNAVSQSVELEKALTRIQIVGKNTRSEVKELGATILSLSSIYGSSATDSVKGATLYAQMGLGKDEIESLMRVTLLGSNVLGTDVETTINTLTAAVKGFGMQVTDASKIMDAWTNVEKQFAVTAIDLAEATKVVSSNAQAMGISMAEALGDVTAIVEVTRKSGSEVGRGLSLIYTRLKTSAVEVIQNVGRVKVYLDEYGNATDAVTNKMRTNFAILTELAQNWQKYGETERTAIGEAVGSKRQMVMFNALMQNYNTSINAQIESLTSAGSAQKAMNLIMDSADYKIKRAEASWREYTAAIIDTNAFKWAIDWINLLNDTDLMVFNNKRWKQKNILEERTPAIAAEQTKLTDLENIQQLINKRKELIELNETSGVQKIDNYFKSQPKEIQALISKPELLPSAIDKQRENLFKQELGIKYNAEVIEARGNKKKLLDIEQRFLQDVKEKKLKFEAQKVLSGSPDEEALDALDISNAKKERLHFDKELLRIKYETGTTDEELLATEIDMLKNSEYLNNTLEDKEKIEKLELSLYEAGLKLKQEETKELQKQQLEQDKLNLKQKLSLELDLKKKANLASYGEAQFSSRQEKIFDIYKKYGAGTAQSIANIFQGGFNEQEVQNSGLYGLFKREFGSDLKNVQMSALAKQLPNLFKDLDASEKNRQLELEYRKEELKSIQELERMSKDNQDRDKAHQEKVVQILEKPIIINMPTKTYQYDPKTGITKEIENY